MLLKVGSKGEDVKKLQAKLGLAADGNFGPGTEAKVKEWQAANGLTADGLVFDDDRVLRCHCCSTDTSPTTGCVAPFLFYYVEINLVPKNNFLPCHPC